MDVEKIKPRRRNNHKKKKKNKKNRKKNRKRPTQNKLFYPLPHAH